MRQADQDKEVRRDSEGVSKGKVRREDGEPPPSRSLALAPGTPPASCPRCVGTAVAALASQRQ